jgi:hypothetical protein
LLRRGAYLDVLSDSMAMWAFPSSKLSEYCEQIAVLASANKTLTMFHARRRGTPNRAIVPPCGNLSSGFRPEAGFPCGNAKNFLQNGNIDIAFVLVL